MSWNVECRVETLKLVGDHTLHGEASLDPRIHRCGERVRTEHFFEERVPLAFRVSDELAPRVKRVLLGAVAGRHESPPCYSPAARAVGSTSLSGFISLSVSRSTFWYRSRTSIQPDRKISPPLVSEYMRRAGPDSDVSQKLETMPVFSSCRSVRYTVPESNSGNPAFANC